MNIQSNGDVGIGAGVFTPTAKLHVIGGARITNLVGPGTVIADASGNLSVVAGSSVTGTGTTNYLARWTSPTQLGIGATFDNGTSVGIGTPTPGKLAGATKYLTLAGTDLGITNATASLEIVGNTASTNTMASKVDFLGLDPVNVAIPRARIEARSGNGQTLAGQMLFYVNSNGSAANLIERMRIRESGEVGIGNIGVVGSLLSIGASDQFQVSSAGNLIRINNVPYTWPAANAAGFLSNDGAGTLSWSTAGVLAGGTASKVTFWTSANSVSANNSFSWDNTNIRLGVGIAAPDATLNVDGTWDIGTANTVTGATSGAIGSSNTVAGNRALALGNFTSAASLGAMVLGDWSSGAPTILTSSASDQFSARFAGGYRFYTNSTLTATQGIYFSTLGKVGIGVAAPLEAIHAASVDTDVDLETYSTTESSSLHIKRARGTIAVPTLPVSGDYYGGVGFQGWNGTAFQEGARIQGVFDGTPSATSMPGRIEFWTTPVGSNIAVERMRLFNDGNIAIGTTAAGYGLYQAQSLGTNAKIVTISGMTTYTDDAPAVLELRGSSIITAPPRHFEEQRQTRDHLQRVDITEDRFKAPRGRRRAHMRLERQRYFSEPPPEDGITHVRLGLRKPRDPVFLRGDRAAQAPNLRENIPNPMARSRARSDLGERGRVAPARMRLRRVKSSEVGLCWFSHCSCLLDPPRRGNRSPARPRADERAAPATATAPARSRSRPLRAGKNPAQPRRRASRRLTPPRAPANCARPRAPTRRQPRLLIRLSPQTNHPTADRAAITNEYAERTHGHEPARERLSAGDRRRREIHAPPPHRRGRVRRRLRGRRQPPPAPRRREASPPGRGGDVRDRRALPPRSPGAREDRPPERGRRPRDGAAARRLVLYGPGASFRREPARAPEREKRLSAEEAVDVLDPIMSALHRGPPSAHRSSGYQAGERGARADDGRRRPPQAR